MTTTIHTPAQLAEKFVIANPTAAPLRAKIEILVAAVQAEILTRAEESALEPPRDEPDQSDD